MGVKCLSVHEIEVYMRIEKKHSSQGLRLVVIIANSFIALHGKMVNGNVKHNA